MHQSQPRLRSNIACDIRAFDGSDKRWTERQTGTFTRTRHGCQPAIAYTRGPLDASGGRSFLTRIKGVGAAIIPGSPVIPRHLPVGTMTIGAIVRAGRLS